MTRREPRLSEWPSPTVLSRIILLRDFRYALLLGRISDLYLALQEGMYDKTSLVS